jgi:toxin ParE1/3/4
VTYVALENPAAARRVQEEIESQIEVLTRYPDRGRPGRIVGTRELVINRTSYIAAYRVTGGTVIILRVLHGSRMWPRDMA